MAEEGEEEDEREEEEAFKGILVSSDKEEFPSEVFADPTPLEGEEGLREMAEKNRDEAERENMR